MQVIYNAIEEIRKFNPWIGYLLRRVRKVPSTQFPTMATDGKHIYINLDFANSLTLAELCGVLVHEAMHIINRHSLRRGDRDPRKFNIACDHAINGNVLDLGWPLPDGALKRIDGMSAEQIYSNLPEQPPQPQGGESSESDDSDSNSQQDDSNGGESGGTDDSGEPETQSGDSGDSGEGDASGADSDASDDASQGTGDAESSDSDDSAGSGAPTSAPGDASADDGVDLLDYPLEPGQSMQDAEREIDGLMAGAELDARMAGDSPSHEEASGEAWPRREDTSLNWPRELEDIIQFTGGADYSMRPPHIGLMSQGIICNQLNPTGAGNVVLIVDVSGSLNREKLERAVEHLMLFVENIDYDTLRVIAHNSLVVYDREFSRGETVDLTDMPTGGGTWFLDVYDLIDSGEQPDLVIHFTDMVVRADHVPEYAPAYPVVWLVDNEYAVENGEWSDDWLNNRVGRYGEQWQFSPDWGHIIDATQ